MTKLVKFRLTATREYFGRPEDYGTSDPVKMATIDMEGDLYMLLDSEDTVWNIDVVEEQDNG